MSVLKLQLQIFYFVQNKNDISSLSAGNRFNTCSSRGKPYYSGKALANVTHRCKMLFHRLQNNIDAASPVGF